jgi:xanthine/CO dehydrogenase XdhC/CoxF family maturation factor
MVVDHEGSVPGTTGAAMVVSSSGCAGTVGGGTAEHHAIELAHGFDVAPELVDIEHTPDGSGSLCSDATLALVGSLRRRRATLAAICDAARRPARHSPLSLHGISFEPGATAAQRLATDAGFSFATVLGRLDTLTIVGGGHRRSPCRGWQTLPFPDRRPRRSARAPTLCQHLCRRDLTVD